MNIGILGVGHIGGGLAAQLSTAGHPVMVSFSRDPERLKQLAAEMGPNVSSGSAAEAVAFADVVIISVPWNVIDEALSQGGDLAGKVVIDTTNQFSRSGLASLPAGQTAATFNATRMPGARYTKSFNTLTSAFQASAAHRTGPHRVVQWLCGDDIGAKEIVTGLIDDAGFIAVDVGGLADATVMEAPRRPGAVYGEEYHLPDAVRVVAALQANQPIPATPSYE